MQYSMASCHIIVAIDIVQVCYSHTAWCALMLMTCDDHHCDHVIIILFGTTICDQAFLTSYNIKYMCSYYAP